MVPGCVGSPEKQASTPPSTPLSTQAPEPNLVDAKWVNTKLVNTKLVNTKLVNTKRVNTKLVNTKQFDTKRVPTRWHETGLQFWVTETGDSPPIPRKESVSPPNLRRPSPLNGSQDTIPLC